MISIFMEILGWLVYALIALWVCITTLPYYGPMAIAAGAFWPAYFALVFIGPRHRS